MQVTWLLFLTIILIDIWTSYGENNSDSLCTKWDKNVINTLSQETVKETIDSIREFIPVITTDDSIFDIKSAYEDYNRGMLDEEILLNITQMIEKNGFPVEEHEVTTSDGYILGLFRIPGNGSVVFVMHGLMQNADIFVTTGKERAFAYVLAAAGHDVWLGNIRGNVHSRRHKNLSPDCIEFWDFSWDDIGRKDLPAMIDYVLEETNQDNLQYIGVSQGTTVFFVLCSEKPEYNDKISIMIALAPVAWVSHILSLNFRLASLYSHSRSSFEHMFGHEITPKNDVTKAINDIVCGTPETATLFCNNLSYLDAFVDYSQINATYLPNVGAHSDTAVSAKTLLHYGQGILSGKFRQYDYGELENLEKYGSLNPPDYPVQKISTRVVIFQGDSDVVADEKDVNILMKNLPNFNITSDYYRIQYKSFNHNDYVIANDVKTLVYDKVLTFLNNNE